MFKFNFAGYGDHKIFGDDIVIDNCSIIVELVSWKKYGQSAVALMY